MCSLRKVDIILQIGTSSEIGISSLHERTVAAKSVASGDDVTIVVTRTNKRTTGQKKSKALISDGQIIDLSKTLSPFLRLTRSDLPSSEVNAAAENVKHTKKKKCAQPA